MGTLRIVLLVLIAVACAFRIPSRISYNALLHHETLFETHREGIWRNQPLQMAHKQYSPSPYAAASQTSSSTIDGRRVTEGCIVEYVSAKGSKRIALISKRKGSQVDALNDARIAFTIPINRITYNVDGKFEFGDLLRLNEMLEEMRPNQVERLWEELVGDADDVTAEAAASTSPFAPDSLSVSPSITAAVLSRKLFGLVDPMRLFVTHRLMSTHGAVFFEPTDCHTSSSANPSYKALSPAAVQSNLRDRSALRELKQRYKMMQEAKASSTSNVKRAVSISSLPAGMLAPDLPERMLQVLEVYAEGLKQLVIKGHPWVVSGWAKRSYDEKLAQKGRELLDMLDLAPSVKNAKKILAFTGLWPLHSNIEKYIMQIRDTFPQEVIDEAEYLLNNQDSVPDIDERIRRDLRHLGTYAIDREGASEVDDAISIETLEDGREKLWVHIADVSRWIRPGSLLSIEAEKRMLSVYLPDEKIPMFPEVLSTELLSLGANIDSFSLSCGVTLTSTGEVDSYEVCPSLVRVIRRLSYTHLDEILKEEGESAQEVPSVSFGPDHLEVEKAKAAATISEGGVAANRSSTSESHTLSLTALLAESTAPTVKDGQPKTRSGGALKNVDPKMQTELQRLNHWATIRHAHRIRQGALDQYLRHKTELYLNVKQDVKSNKYNVQGYTTWTNGTSMSLVSEYMILMCQTVGGLCERIKAPVWFKIQSPEPPLGPADLELQPGESLFLRSARIMRNLRTANDSKVPGPHSTSGSLAYVQCTSPIRRYHDLYNHYRLKAAMHGASMAEDLADLANEEAGITKLDIMATEGSRLQTLNAIRLVTRHREQYWLSLYIERQLAIIPRVVFDCLVSDVPKLFSDQEELSIGAAAGGDGRVKAGDDSAAIDTSSADEDSQPGFLSDALILQLGSFVRYKLFHMSASLSPGDVVKCHLYKRYTNPVSYILMPVDIRPENAPLALVAQLTRKNGSAEADAEDDEF